MGDLMAVGKEAEQVWRLHADMTEMGNDADEWLFGALVRFLDKDTLDDFVEHFRRHSAGVLPELDDENTEAFDLNLIQCSEV